MAKVYYLAFVGDGHGWDNTPGKRTPYIKSLGRQVRENEFNKPTADMLVKELKRAGVNVYHVAPEDEDVSLKDRTDRANKIYWQYCSKYGKENVKAVYISIHFNAFDGSFGGADPSGFSVHIYPGSKSGRALAQKIIDELKNGTKQNNRGIKENNFHVVRETVMPAALLECGFMDNKREAMLMLNKDFQQEVAIETAKGVLNNFGLKYVAAPKPEPKQEAKKGLYKVQVGAFGVKENAERLEKQLHAAGFKDTFIKFE